MRPETLEVAWGAPASVRAVYTTRRGGASAGRYAECNLGVHVGDDPARVARNRRAVVAATGQDGIQWLDQVHGSDVVRVDAVGPAVKADAAWTARPGIALAVAVADCVPAVVCDAAGTVAGVVHCGWRGAVGGIVEAAVRELPARAGTLQAWLGPAICGRCYEVRRDVYDRAGGGPTFRRAGADTWRFDLPEYVARRFETLGVGAVVRSGLCTRCDDRFFSHRRDGVTGRSAAVVWLDSRS
ncbi:MAG: peptidoglycan editing factor PgeF [Gammaproteobacteria bacterium]|nr:peptidoglycan editing factor PgeF [Gammaproteobacteria bacterium]